MAAVLIYVMHMCGFVHECIRGSVYRAGSNCWLFLLELLVLGTFVGSVGTLPIFSAV